MPIYIDDARVDLPGDDLAAVLDAARGQLQPRERVVVEVEVDGRTLPADELDKASEQPVEGREVRLSTADPRQLVGETLGQVRQRLDDAKQIHEHAADRLQADESAEAMQSLGQAIEIWIQTQQTVLHASMLLSLDLDALTVDGRPFDQLTRQLLERLQSLKAHLQDEDTVALADELAYEWPEVIEHWQRLVETLIQRVES